MASGSVTASDSAKVDVCADICAQLPTAVKNEQTPMWMRRDGVPALQASPREAAAYEETKVIAAARFYGWFEPKLADEWSMPGFESTNPDYSHSKNAGDPDGRVARLDA